MNILRASAEDGRLAEYFTGTGIRHFTGKELRAYVFPLAPLTEQQRIVAKVDELMTICDRLETSLEAADSTRCKLLESLLHEALVTEFGPVEGSETESVDTSGERKPRLRE